MPQRTIYPDSEQRFDDAARASLQGNLALAEQLYRAEPTDSVLHGIALAQLAQLIGRTARWAEAEQLAREAIKDFEANGILHGASYLLAHRVLGERAADRHAYDDAATHLRRACHEADVLLDAAEARRLNGGDIDVEAREIRELATEKANALNSLGGSLLLAREPEEAVAVLQQARDCQARAGDPTKEGVAEVLTHLAMAYRQVGEGHRAHLALQEALDVAGASGNTEQLFRTQVELYNLDPRAEELPAGALWLEAAAERAETSGADHVAYVRWCLAVERSLDENDPSRAELLLERALALEERLPDAHLETAALRLSMALIKKASGDPSDQIASLLDGAERWYRIVQERRSLKDVERLTRLMHEHFRTLTFAMIALGRVEEALCAFEYGRSLAHALETFPEILNDIGSPVVRDQPTVSTSLAHAARDRLEANEVVIVTAMLPGMLVAFVLGKDGTRAITQDVGADHAEVVNGLGALPSALRSGRGRDAVPGVVMSLAAKVVATLGDVTVAGSFPHALLHAVPWRIVFHSLGLPLVRLPMPVGFGLALWAFRPTMMSTPSIATALGFGLGGLTEQIDFQDEAIEFAEKWGDTAELLDACSANVATALRLQQVVYLSSHGHQEESAITLALRDGRVTIPELLGNERVGAPIILLSACYSATYFVRFGDHPVGPAPELLRRGARVCIGSRWPIRVQFTRAIFPLMAPRLRAGQRAQEVLIGGLEEIAESHDLWRDLACIEILCA